MLADFIPSCEIQLASHALRFAAPALAFHAPGSRGRGRARGPAYLRARRGFPYEVGQPVERIEAVAMLAAMALRGDRDDAIAARPASGQTDEARAHVFRQGGRVRGIEAQLHGRRDLVDVLAAGTRCAYERNGYFMLPYLDSRRYLDHAAPNNIMLPSIGALSFILT